jgi:RHS repeat-associated protein
VDGVLVQGWLYQDQLNPVAELDGVGNVISQFIYGTRANVPDYVIRNDTTYRIVADHLGSVRLVVKVTDGAVVQRVAYDEFGREVGNTNPGFQPFGYAGGLTDAQTRLTRFGMRDFDPFVGRWATKDQIVFAGASANLYAYVLDDPVNLIDPKGLGPCGCGQEALEFGKSFLFDAIGVKLLSASVRYLRALRIQRVVRDNARIAAELRNAGLTVEALVHDLAAEAALNAARAEGAQILPMILIEGSIQADQLNSANWQTISRLDAAAALELSKLLPVWGSGLKFGELLNCLGFGV